jgi:hypothetical protein
VTLHAADKIRRHAGLASPLVAVLDLSSPIIEDRDIAAMLCGRMVTTMPTSRQTTCRAGNSRLNASAVPAGSRDSTAKTSRPSGARG